MAKELYKSSSFKGYSLWLSPKGQPQVNGLLETLIAKASHAFHSPSFQPHVTLLGAIEASAEEVIQKTQALAAKLGPTKIPLVLDEIAVGDAYFQCVLWKVATTPDTQTLREVNQLARGVFDREDDPVFFPHLSLVYGDFSPQVRQEIRERIGRGDFVELKDEHLRFEVGSILVVNTEGKPHEWQVIAEVELS
ncbi:LigT-like protein [Basidiobolus meristosporus CBS 931.73]|uniref:LigT-like protein n=1 Tax=Basidiobolus meristosporus CBS 931.73 TaxID=1314790 RepID=A0A1Y1XSG1_9FUNG|nr:LigT-like protein [Basidiobolus meristosporus CBS 931.73]|eukprot:ORX88436.1 LigT-like protein [Basidiobolus meristosporus CBS 931.73]